MSDAVEKRQGNKPTLTPPADIVQQDSSYYIIMDMPGVNKDDLNISIDKQVLTVEAETELSISQGEKFLENEFSEAVYSRKFTLSDAVDKNNIKANLKNGLLKLHLPKAEEEQPKKIEIQAG